MTDEIPDVVREVFPYITPMIWSMYDPYRRMCTTQTAQLRRSTIPRTRSTVGGACPVCGTVVIETETTVDDEVIDLVVECLDCDWSEQCD